MTRLSHRSGVEEKGRRAARSDDVYLPKEGMEVSWCGKCGVIYRRKRWIMDEAELEQIRKDPDAGVILCPACQRMRDNVPGGIVTFNGGYMEKHEEEILELIKNIEEKSRAKNPLGRIMEIRRDGNELSVSTTEDKLAQKLGRDIFRAHKGELHFKWSEGEKFVRVDWQRD